MLGISINLYVFISEKDGCALIDIYMHMGTLSKPLLGEI